MTSAVVTRCLRALSQHARQLSNHVTATRVLAPPHLPLGCGGATCRSNRVGLALRRYHDTPSLTADAVAAETIKIDGESFPRDRLTNVTPRIASHVARDLPDRRRHPLWHVKNRIRDYFHATYRKSGRTPLFSLCENLSPIVTIEQNFDSLLTPTDHVSRSPADSYYVNEGRMLRAHTSAHQRDLVRMGLDAFLVVGDCYRRDEIDASHYPVFHQCEGVRLFTEHQLFGRVEGGSELHIHTGDANGLPRRPERQQSHTLEAVKLAEHDLKVALEGLARNLFGDDIQLRWVDTYFPFTHPSWELEIYWKDDWMECLGCGIMEHKILESAGAGNKIGWAFGLGLDRLAMLLYDIPDIRLLWSEDSGFLSQFDFDDSSAPVKYQPISIYPQCTSDMSFWTRTAIQLMTLRLVRALEET
ncbi:PREDICTED: phenylalanine--tRNA ligase, mitochondrial-like [Priapulus caudatus]|uniref:phenylalanine--tRNA ligase n=1 Tax=Priapulus caudatus TaxID=37621 RepID=A0ABM1F3F7_PRICU|nr:PREDICTED: phenylalanine--tRNA ligase, mitochondrial-like [Priapulus caudatus]